MIMKSFKEVFKWLIESEGANPDDLPRHKGILRSVERLGCWGWDVEVTLDNGVFYKQLGIQREKRDLERELKAHIGQEIDIGYKDVKTKGSDRILLEHSGLGGCGPWEYREVQNVRY